MTKDQRVDRERRYHDRWLNIKYEKSELMFLEVFRVREETWGPGQNYYSKYWGDWYNPKKRPIIKQVCLHHTGAAHYLDWIFKHFVYDIYNATQRQGKYVKVCVDFFIGLDGRIYQYYPIEYWAYHLGSYITQNNNKQNREILGIEIGIAGGFGSEKAM